MAENNKYFKIMITESGHTLLNNREIIYHIFVNETSIFNVHQSHIKDDHSTVCLNFITQLSQNDYVELRLETLVGNIDYHLHSYNIIIDPI